MRSDRRSVTISLVIEDAEALYDHTGTMPPAPGSWSHNVRAELSQALFGISLAVEHPPTSEPRPPERIT